jgi:hypothetical protein
MKRIVFYTLLFLAFLIQGCDSSDEFGTDNTTKPYPWTHLKFNNNPEIFQFAIISDRTGRVRPGVFADGIKKISLLQPEFVITVGDIIEGYKKNEDQIEEQWDMMMGVINKLEMPFFFIPGNHDFNNELTKKVWKVRFGKDYYYFVYKNVLFLCLNGSGPIEDDQIEYFNNVLGNHQNVRWTLVFIHKPRWEREKNDDWNKFEHLLENRDYTVFAGHMHVYNKEIRNGKKYYTLATTGGKSGLSGPAHGEFDHVMWITMTDDGPMVTNLTLDGIFDDDPRDDYEQ